MTIKEFSNKNSVALFYSSLILFILVVVLFFALAYEGGKARQKPGIEDYKNRENQILGKNQSKSTSGSSITVNVLP